MILGSIAMHWFFHTRQTGMFLLLGQRSRGVGYTLLDIGSCADFHIVPMPLPLSDRGSLLLGDGGAQSECRRGC